MADRKGAAASASSSTLCESDTRGGNVVNVELAGTTTGASNARLACEALKIPAVLESAHLVLARSGGRTRSHGARRDSSGPGVPCMLR